MQEKKTVPGFVSRSTDPRVKVLRAGDKVIADGQERIVEKIGGPAWPFSASVEKPSWFLVYTTDGGIYHFRNVTQVKQ